MKIFWEKEERLITKPYVPCGPDGQIWKRNPYSKNRRPIPTAQESLFNSNSLRSAKSNSIRIAVYSQRYKYHSVIPISIITRRAKYSQQCLIATLYKLV